MTKPHLFVQKINQTVWKFSETVMKTVLKQLKKPGQHSGKTTLAGSTINQNVWKFNEHVINHVPNMLKTVNKTMAKSHLFVQKSFKMCGSSMKMLSTMC
jgi:hypothetical protein